MDSIKETLLFLTISRSLLADSCDNIVEKKFFLQEATDYEILHCLVRERLPKEKENIKYEHELLEELKIYVEENSHILQNYISEECMRSILEFEPLSNYGFPNSSVLLESFSDFDNIFLAEQNPLSALKNLQKELEKLGKQEKVVKGELKKARKAAGGLKLDPYTAFMIGKPAFSAVKSLSGKLYKIGSEKAKLLRKINLAKQASQASALASAKAAGAVKGVQGVAASLATIPATHIIAGVALAAILAYAAYKTYQRFFSKAAKACKGKKGKEKTECMNKYKLNALQKQQIELRKAMIVCKKSKTPDTCKKRINRRIEKTKDKITDLRSKLQESILEADVNVPISVITSPAQRAYYEVLTRIERECEDLKGKEKQACETEIKIRALETKIRGLRSAAGNCDRAKEPDSCRESIRNKIDSTRERLDNERRKFLEIRAAI